MMEHDNVRKKNVYMYVYWVALLYSRKLTEHCKPTIVEKTKIIINEKKKVRTLYFLFFLFFFCLLSFVFLGPHPQHMEVPRPGVKLDLQLPAYAYATAKPDPSCICHLHHSSQQCQSLTHWERPGIEPVSSWMRVGVANHWATMGSPRFPHF